MSSLTVPAPPRAAPMTRGRWLRADSQEPRAAPGAGEATGGLSPVQVVHEGVVSVPRGQDAAGDPFVGVVLAGLEHDPHTGRPSWSEALSEDIDVVVPVQLEHRDETLERLDRRRFAPVGGAVAQGFLDDRRPGVFSD